eukprot:s1291_g4.t1
MSFFPLTKHQVEHLQSKVRSFYTAQRARVGGSSIFFLCVLKKDVRIDADVRHMHACVLPEGDHDCQSGVWESCQRYEDMYQFVSKFIVSEEWWNLNSTRKRPAKVGAFYLAAWLAQLEVEGNTIFVVLGRLPPLSAPAGSDKHLLENFHELADLRRRAETSGGNPVAHEPDSEDEGAQWAQAMAAAETEIESKPRISLEQACAGMREMGFKTNQIEIALRLASGDGEVASHFLVIMEPLADRKVLEDPTSWAKLIQASVLGLDSENASMEVLVQGMLRIATLLDSPQDLPCCCQEHHVLMMW